MWWGVLSELAETKNNLSAFNAKARVVEQKTQCSFVDSRETMWGSQCGGHGLNRLLDLLI